MIATSGGTGTVGPALLQELADSAAGLGVFVRDAATATAPLARRLEVARSSFADPASMRGAFRETGSPRTFEQFALDYRGAFGVSAAA